MKFAPKTQEEITLMNMVDPGQYKFQVINAREATSKNGNDMISLVIKIWDKKGSERIVYDHLLEQMPFKLRHFAECTGLIDLYDKGELFADDCKNKSGYLELIIQKDKTGAYPDRNAVKDYIVSQKKHETVKIAANVKKDDFQDDLDIPF